MQKKTTNSKKRKILLGTLIPLATASVTPAAICYLTSCSTNSNNSLQQKTFSELLVGDTIKKIILTQDYDAQADVKLGDIANERYLCTINGYIRLDWNGTFISIYSFGNGWMPSFTSNDCSWDLDTLTLTGNIVLVDIPTIINSHVFNSAVYFVSA